MENIIMTTKTGKRIAFTPSQRLSDAIERIAKLTGQGKGAVVADLLGSSAGQLERLANLIEMANQAQQNSNLLGEAAAKNLVESFLASYEKMSFLDEESKTEIDSLILDFKESSK